jgi:hypothetical protein
MRAPVPLGPSLLVLLQRHILPPFIGRRRPSFLPDKVSSPWRRRPWMSGRWAPCGGWSSLASTFLLKPQRLPHLLRRQLRRRKHWR